MERELQDGVYKSGTATYFVKDNRVLMLLMGDYYKTNYNFMIGAEMTKPLTESQKESFDRAYEAAKRW